MLNEYSLFGHLESLGEMDFHEDNEENHAKILACGVCWAILYTVGAREWGNSGTREGEISIINTSWKNELRETYFHFEFVWLI